MSISNPFSLDGETALVMDFRKNRTELFLLRLHLHGFAR